MAIARLELAVERRRAALNGSGGGSSSSGGDGDGRRLTTTAKCEKRDVERHGEPKNNAACVQRRRQQLGNFCGRRLRTDRLLFSSRKSLAAFSCNEAACSAELLRIACFTPSIGRLRLLVGLCARTEAYACVRSRPSARRCFQMRTSRRVFAPAWRRRRRRRAPARRRRFLCRCRSCCKRSPFPIFLFDVARSRSRWPRRVCGRHSRAAAKNVSLAFNARRRRYVAKSGAFSAATTVSLAAGDVIRTSARFKVARGDGDRFFARLFCFADGDRRRLLFFFLAVKNWTGVKCARCGGSHAPLRM